MHTNFEKQAVIIMANLMPGVVSLGEDQGVVHHQSYEDGTRPTHGGAYSYAKSEEDRDAILRDVLLIEVKVDPRLIHRNDIVQAIRDATPA